MAIIELLCRLTDPHPAEIGVQVNLRTDDFVELSAPHRDLHLIMRIVNARIEDVDFSIFEVRSNIAVPEVTVNKGWLHNTSFCFQWPKNLWDYVSD